MLNTKKLFTKILTNMRGCIKYEYHTKTQSTTIASGNSASLNVSYTAPTGYVLLGLGHSQTNGGVAASYPLYQSQKGTTSGTITVWMRNGANSSVTITSVGVGVFYIRQDLYVA